MIQKSFMLLLDSYGLFAQKYSPMKILAEIPYLVFKTSSPLWFLFVFYFFSYAYNESPCLNNTSVFYTWAFGHMSVFTFFTGFFLTAQEQYLFWLIKVALDRMLELATLSGVNQERKHWKSYLFFCNFLVPFLVLFCPFFAFFQLKSFICYAQEKFGKTF